MKKHDFSVRRAKMLLHGRIQTAIAIKRRCGGDENESFEKNKQYNRKL